MTRTLKRITYPTMNSWNGEYSPAYNLKIFDILPRKLQDRAYEIYADENLARVVYDDIEARIADFTAETGYKAGFNGRQGGYLVLYRPDGTLRGIDANDLDGATKRAFRRLALDIISIAKHYCRTPIETETYTIEKERKYFA